MLLQIVPVVITLLVMLLMVSTSVTWDGGITDDNGGITDKNDTDTDDDDKHVNTIVAAASQADTPIFLITPESTRVNFFEGGVVDDTVLETNTTTCNNNDHGIDNNNDAYNSDDNDNNNDDDNDNNNDDDNDNNNDDNNDNNDNDNNNDDNNDNDDDDNDDDNDNNVDAN